MNTEDLELFTAAELGEALRNIPPTTVMEWQHRFNWPHVRFGRKYRWTREQVAEIVRRHIIIPASDTSSAKALPADGRTSRSASKRTSR